MVPRAAAISRSERRKARTTAAILDAAERHFLERAFELFETYMEEDADAEGGALEQLLDTAGRVARFGRARPGHMRILSLPQPRDDEELSGVVDQVERALADQ